MIHLTAAEKRLSKQLAGVKEKSGSHSPSPAMLASVAGVKVRHDFCFLSNPHATELFLRYFRRDMLKGKTLRAAVEYYPSQNPALAEKLAESPLLKGALPSSVGGLFVGNGATEIIQAVLHNFAKKKVLVPIPTFSPYVEFAPRGVKTIIHQLRKENDFQLETKRFLAEVKKEKPDTVVIISPNNPEGGYLNVQKLQLLLTELRGVDTVIVDESFIHFAGKEIESVSHLVQKYPNLVVIKSLSKDFGIAGLRLGYAVMAQKRVQALLERGYLWNVSGFGEYFLDVLNREDFLKAYEQARRKAIGERDEFFMQLQKLKEIKVYPSKANAFLIELLDGTKASDLCVRLLVKHGIYIRTCYDKVGLSGEFIRIASRRREENKKLIQALITAFS